MYKNVAGIRVRVLGVMAVAMAISPVVLSPVTAFVAMSPRAAFASDPAANAKYTLVLAVFQQADHIKYAKVLRSALVEATGRKDTFIINETNVSTLYCGYYTSIDQREDHREAQRAQTDLQQFINMDIRGSKPFSGALIVVLPTPDPAAPAEWNLRNASGAFSLEVGAYKDDPHRKEAAVQAVKDARAMGLEAYYYHGPTTSSVCIGSFPLEAIREVTPDAKAAPGVEVIVVPYRPPDMKEEIERPDGSKARVVEHRFEILDPVLRGLMRQYPEHAVNGEIPVRVVTDPSGKTVQEKAESCIVSIADLKKQTSMVAAGPADGGGADRSAQGAVVPRPSTPGSGRLKSVGD